MTSNRTCHRVYYEKGDFYSRVISDNIRSIFFIITYGQETGDYFISNEHILNDLVVK